MEAQDELKKNITDALVAVGYQAPESLIAALAELYEINPRLAREIERKLPEVKLTKRTGANDELADQLALDFYEAEGGVDHPVFQAWCKCAEVFGEISSDRPTDCINELFRQTIRYVIDSLGIKDDA